MDFIKIFPEEVSELVFRILSEREFLFKYLVISKNWNEFINDHSNLLIIDQTVSNNKYYWKSYETILENLLKFSNFKKNVRITGVKINCSHIDSMFSRFFKFSKLLANVKSIEIMFIHQRWNADFQNIFDKIFCLAPNTKKIKIVTGNYEPSNQRITIKDDMFENGKLLSGQPIINATSLIENLEIINGSWFSKSTPIMFNNLKTLSISGYFPLSVAINIIEMNPNIETLQFTKIDSQLNTILKCSLSNSKVVEVYKKLKSFTYTADEKFKSNILNGNDFNKKLIFPNLQIINLFGLSIDEIGLKLLCNPKHVKQLGLEYCDFRPILKSFYNVDALYIRMEKDVPSYKFATIILECKTLKFLIFDNFTYSTLLRVLLFIKEFKPMKIVHNLESDSPDLLNELLKEGLIDDLI